MARGDSGRIVLEINPSQKEELYSALTKDGLTLKDWFLQQASLYLKDHSQPSLFSHSVVAEEQTPYRVKAESTVSPMKKKQRSGKSKIR